MTIVVETKHLSKMFKGKELLSDINMQVEKGTIYGLLGPNGAGKTTLMKALVNLIKPSEGTIAIFGRTIKPQEYRYLKQIGALIEQPVLYNELTAVENLELHSQYFSYQNKTNIQEVLALVDLTDAAQEKVKSYSLGMKQRLGIAKALLIHPELLILDEPINGLDPSGIHDMRRLFKKLANEWGTTIIISSHILSELEQIVDKIGIIQKGQLIEELTLEELQRKSASYIKIVSNDTQKLVAHLVLTLNITNYKIVGDNQINIYDQNHSYNAILAAINTSGTNILTCEQIQSSLEDYYLNKVGKGELHV